MPRGRAGRFSASPEHAAGLDDLIGAGQPMPTCTKRQRNPMRWRFTCTDGLCHSCRELLTSARTPNEHEPATKGLGLSKSVRDDGQQFGRIGHDEFAFEIEDFEVHGIRPFPP